MDKNSLLAYIVAQSAGTRTAQNPNGFCYLQAGTEGLATELHNEELIEALVSSRAADNSYPVRPTDLGMKWVQAAAVQAQAQQTKAPAPQPQPQPQAQAPLTPAQQHMATIAAIPVEAGVPVPAKKEFGRRSSGETVLDKFPFATMEVNHSFFVPQDNPPKKDEDGHILPKHRTFSSVVSQANKKLHPRSFIIREWAQPDGTVGARVWRTEDMQGERPVRPRKNKGAAQAPAAQHQGGFTPPAAPQPGFAPPAGGGFPQPGFAGAPAAGGGFPAPGPGFPAPAGFPAPGAAPAGWGAAPAGGPLPSFDQ